MDPQSFNRYAYFSNRPMAAIDEDGLCGDGDASDCGDDRGDSGDSGGFNQDGSSASGVTVDDAGAAYASVSVIYGYSNPALSAQTSTGTFSSYISQTLDIIGLAPESGAFANGADAAIQYSQGNNAQAALYAAGAAASVFGVPGGSAVAKLGKALALARQAEELEQVGALVAAKTAGQLGKEGEAAVRAAHDVGDKPKFILMNGRGRIPDGLKPGESLSKVKNVDRLSCTRQLRDYSEYSQAESLRFDLYTR